MTGNPYAPPKTDGEPPVGGGGDEEDGISFNDYDLETVSKMTTWMRRVSTLQYVFGALVAALTAWICAVAGKVMLTTIFGQVVVGVLVVYVLMFFVGAGWLKASCAAFYDGVMSDSEVPLALGFRKLRLYLVLYGTFTVVGLAFALVGLLQVRR